MHRVCAYVHIYLTTVNLQQSQPPTKTTQSSALEISSQNGLTKKSCKATAEQKQTLRKKKNTGLLDWKRSTNPDARPFQLYKKRFKTSLAPLLPLSTTPQNSQTLYTLLVLTWIHDPSFATTAWNKAGDENGTCSSQKHQCHDSSVATSRLVWMAEKWE